MVRPEGYAIANRDGAALFADGQRLKTDVRIGHQFAIDLKGLAEQFTA
jgi:hypothetical protein